MINDLILKLIYTYLIGMLGVLFYYLFLYGYAVYISRQYDMQIDNWGLENKGIFLIFCPIVNIVAAVVMWMLIHKPMKTIELMIIMSTHPDMQDPPEDEDIW